MAFIDQTADFQSLIASGSKSGPSKTRPKPPRRQSEEEKADSFLKEAYQIVSRAVSNPSPFSLDIGGLSSSDLSAPFKRSSVLRKS